MKERPANRAIPVMLISTKTLAEWRGIASASSADACVQKSLGKVELQESINRLAS